MTGRLKDSRGWDLCAAGLSSLCLVHCLLLPMAAALLPPIAQLSDSHLAHVCLVALAAPITVWVVWRMLTTDSGTATRVTSIVALSGLGLLVAAVAVPALHDVEVHLTVVGATLLGGVHLWRWFRPASVLSD